MNNKIRWQNKTFVVTLITSIVAAVYQILGIIGIVPPISQDLIIQLVGIFANILVTLGIWVDPTTDGVSDSEVTLKKTDISDFYTEGSGLTISMLYNIDSKEYRMNFKNLSMLNDSIKKPVPDVTETDSHSLYFHDPAIMYAGRLINRGVALGKTGKTGKTASDALSQLTVELLKKNDTGEWVPANFSELY